MSTSGQEREITLIWGLAHIWSTAAVAVEILLMTSNLIGQYRFDFKRPYRGKFLRAAKPA